MLEIVKYNRNFRYFWFGQSISQLGDRIHTLAVIWLVYSWYNSGVMVGIVLIASTLPSFLLSPIAGNLLDKFNRKQIMIICDFVRMIFVLLISILAFYNQINITIVITITIIISMGAAFFNPATMAIMPTIVEPAQLTKANAFYQLSVNTSAAIGFMIGSGLIALIGVPVAFLINGFSFLFSAYFLFKLDYHHTKMQNNQSFWLDFKEGWKISRQIPLISELFFPIVLINFFLAAFYILIPILAEGVFKQGSAGVGIMMSSLTIGMLVGAILISTVQFKIKTITLVFPSIVFIGCIFLFMYFFESYINYIISFSLIGLLVNLTNIALIALLQKSVPNNIRGKVFGLLTSASVSAQPISYGLMGFLVDSMNPEVIILICFFAFTLTAFSFLRVSDLKKESLT